MRKKKIALLLSATMVFSSVPANSLTGLAEEVIAEDMNSEEVPEEPELFSEIPTEPELFSEVPAEPELFSEASAENPVLSEESEGTAETDAEPEEVIPESIVPEEEADGEVASFDTESALPESELPDGSGFIESVETVDYFSDGEPSDDGGQQEDGATFATAVTLTTTEEKTVVIENPGDSYYFKFTAPNAGLYSFCSNAGGADTEAILFDADYKELDDNDDDALSDSYDFRIIRQLEAKKTYYLQARFLNSNATGSFSVSAELHSLKTLSGDSTSVTSEPACWEFFQYTAAKSDTYRFSAGTEDMLFDMAFLDSSMRCWASGKRIIQGRVKADETYYLAIWNPGSSAISHTITIAHSSWELISDYDYFSCNWGQTVTLDPGITIYDAPVTLTYKWEKLNVMSDEYEEISNAEQCTVDRTGNYLFTATDASGYSEKYEADVWVDTGFQADDDTTYLALPKGATAGLEVNASTEHGTLSYTWYMEWRDHDGSWHVEKMPDISGSVATVTIPDVQRLGYYCLVSDGCNHTYVHFSIDIIDCTHKWTTVIDRAPTCAAAGSQHQECSICHTKQAAAAVPATGKHSFGNYVVTTNPTALQEGIKTRTCTVCGKTESASVPKLTPTISLNASKIVLKTKQSTTKLKVSGLAAGDYVASWKSSNTKIVTVNSKGKITAKTKTGKAVITVTLASGLEKKIPVTVQKATVTTSKIKGVSKKLTLAKGKKSALKPVITPITATDKITYKTSNKKVATVSSKGVITAKASGTAKITITSGRKKAVVTVTVPKTKTTAIKGVPATLNVKKGKTYRLKAKLSPKNSEETISYSSSNKKVAAVDKNGRISAKKAGKAKITVKSGKIKIICTVTVK